MSEVTREQQTTDRSDTSANTQHGGQKSKPAPNMRGVGAFIGGSFGLAFVLINASSPMGPGAATVIRFVGVAAFILLVAAVSRARRLGHSTVRSGENLFRKRSYWLIVAGEVALLLLGRVVIGSIGAPPEANVAWIAFVVGLHFVGFALFGVWPRNLIGPSILLIVFGLAGLALTATPAVAWAPLVAGVFSGFTLLAGSLSIPVRRLVSS